MMIISDVTIRKLIKNKEINICPFEEKYIRPASICLRLGEDYLLAIENKDIIDLKDENTFPKYIPSKCNPEKGFILEPSKMVLFNTLEKISLSLNYSGWLSSLSGLARLGIQVVFSQYISPGFGENGLTTIALEIINLNNRPIRIYPGMRICHLVLCELSNQSSRGYDSLIGTYSNQTKPFSSQFYNDFIIK